MSAYDAHPATDAAPWDPDADAQPTGLRIPETLIAAELEQTVRDGAWAEIVAGETDELEIAAEVMLLSDGGVELDAAERIAAFLLEARTKQTGRR